MRTPRRFLTGDRVKITKNIPRTCKGVAISSNCLGNTRKLNPAFSNLKNSSGIILNEAHNVGEGYWSVQIDSHTVICHWTGLKPDMKDYYKRMRYK